MVSSEPLRHLIAGTHAVDVIGQYAVELCAVTGGQDHRLAELGIANQGAERLVYFFRSKSNALAQLNGGRVVVYANYYQLVQHGFGQDPRHSSQLVIIALTAH